MGLAMVAAALLNGCATAPTDSLLLDEGHGKLMQQVMARKDKIISLSSQEMDRDKPVLLLLHGATDDPTEMLKIFSEWRDQYNVFLYSYNYHRPIKKVAADLVREMKALKAETDRTQPSDGPIPKVTVVTYSYSAIVFRMAVILADEPSLFANDSLIQLVPAAGGSSFARSMFFPGVVDLVGIASKPSAAACPYGHLARELWEGKGNRIFYQSIDPAHMRSILLEGDTHSLANAWSKKVQRHYHNGIGPNVIVIPKSAGVTHEYFPLEQGGLDYLRTALEPAAAKPSIPQIQPTLTKAILKPTAVVAVDARGSVTGTHP
jgi:hypothetical protein